MLARYLVFIFSILELSACASVHDQTSLLKLGDSYSEKQPDGSYKVTEVVSYPAKLADLVPRMKRIKDTVCAGSDFNVAGIGNGVPSAALNDPNLRIEVLTIRCASSVSN